MFIITAKKWFQKSYGNTYHSVSVYQDNEFLGYIPFRYGYGDHYLNTAADIMGISETKLRDDIRENRQNYHITVIDVNRKKDL
jgi:hypothetical protein